MDKLKMHSPNLIERNIDKIAELFPTVITEGVDEDGNRVRAVDFDLLQQELSDHVIGGPQERYQLDWPGKREALFAANVPIAKTLRPVREDSVDFDTTQNLFIEGDNLDALKLLQESYLGKVKLIYIDPPYNTGSDLVYRDDFSATKEVYEAKSGQVDEVGNRLVANMESNGRFHSDWLTMIYPRLKLARRLLTDDGVIMVSIDDAEQASLRRISDEIFGERNFIAQLVWEKGRKNDAKFFSTGHEYVLVYAKSKALLRERGTAWREEKPGAREIWDEYVRLRELHGSNNEAIERELTQWFAALPKSEPAKKWSRYRRIDSAGPWRDRDISWPGGDGPRYEVIHPVTGLPCKVPEAGWRYSTPQEMQRQIDLGLVVFREDHTEPPFRKAHLRPIAGESGGESDEEESNGVELANQVRGSYFYKQSQVAVRHLRDLMGAKVFNNPKDHVELSRLFEYVLDGADGIVMDFFAGSGTTGEAVFDLCSRTGQNCPVILVQLPERLEDNLATAAGAAKTTIANGIKYLKKRQKPTVISELTKIRLQASGEHVLSGKSSPTWKRDVGFRVLKVDSTNLTDVLRTPDALGQEQLDLYADSVKPDRTGEDLLFQVLLDWGLELTMPMTVEQVDGSEVLVVEDGALIACFDNKVSAAVVREIASREPLRAVFRDSGFATDADRINAEQVFAEVSPATDVKVI
ncbi:site-specific DNA-methyltransferase [Streptomyces albogriseolus]|uniref:site-specific DNA-methyltransferase n=1 Tax=Streptomyces albogriseolus TaxID=1887 RepID=UPI0034613D67